MRQTQDSVMRRVACKGGGWDLDFGHGCFDVGCNVNMFVENIVAYGVTAWRDAPMMGQAHSVMMSGIWFNGWPYCHNNRYTGNTMRGLVSFRNG